LIGEEWDALGAGQKRNVGVRIMKPQVLQKGQFHDDVAEIPVFNDQYSLHLLRRVTGGAQAIYEPHDRAQNRFDRANQQPFSGAYSDQNTKRSDIGDFASGGVGARRYLDQKQFSPRIR
jgi:hypothetical protein